MAEPATPIRDADDHVIEVGDPVVVELAPPDSGHTTGVVTELRHVPYTGPYVVFQDRYGVHSTRPWLVRVRRGSAHGDYDEGNGPPTDENGW